MHKAVGAVLERNLSEVFGEADAARRARVIAELYAADCIFFEAETQTVGHEALNARVEQIRREGLALSFTAAGAAEVNHDIARLQWRLGLAGAAPVLTGMDIAVFDGGKIRTLYTFLDQPQRR